MRDCVTLNFYFYNPFVSLRLPPPLTQGRLLVKLVFQPQIICDHRDKFRIRGLSAEASLREGGGPLAVEGACVILKFEQMSMLRTLPQSLRASSLPEGAFFNKAYTSA